MNEGNMSEMMQNLNKMMNGKEMPENMKSMLQNIINSNTSVNHSSQDAPHTSTSSNTTGENATDTLFQENNSSQESTEGANPFGNIDMGTIMKMKNIMDKLNRKKNDPRSNLLLSLKPYLKPSRKEKVDQYVQLFAMTDVLENLNMPGGDDKK